MKPTYILAAFLFATSGVQIKALASEPGHARPVVILQSENSDVIAAAPVADGTVIKFDNDSIIFSHGTWRKTVARNEAGFFNHTENHTSNLEVRVLANEEKSVAAGGAVVTLQCETNDDCITVNRTADETGIARFEDVPVGIYSLTVSDDNHIFNTALIPYLVHSLDDEVSLVLEENVVVPQEIGSTTEMTDTGLYNLILDWEIPPTDIPLNYLEEYFYRIYLNGDLSGETGETGYYIKNLKPGPYTIQLYSLTPYGNRSSEPLELSLILDENAIGSVEIDAEDISFEYYRLDGYRVNASELTGGIYIKRYADGRTEKIIIP